MDPSTRVGRFAPSPTGNMHLGNARTALLAWLHSRSMRAKHILRIEDLDSTRVRQAAYDTLRQDLLWLGLDWDEEYTQSERLDVYQHHLAQLHTYPCSCSRKDIAEAASAPHAPETVYPQTCLLNGANPHKPHALRWHVPNHTIEVHDHFLGSLQQHLPSQVGDVVLRRNDGVFAYHLAVVVDDALMGVSEVVRGEDLWHSTPQQVALQQALGFATPRYYHVPLMRDYRGTRLAKRHGAPSVKDLRDSGYSAGKLRAELAASLGWDVPEEVEARDLIDVYSGWCLQAQKLP